MDKETIIKLLKEFDYDKNTMADTLEFLLFMSYNINKLLYAQEDDKE